MASIHGNIVGPQVHWCFIGKILHYVTILYNIGYKLSNQIHRCIKIGPTNWINLSDVKKMHICTKWGITVYSYILNVPHKHICQDVSYTNNYCMDFFSYIFRSSSPSGSATPSSTPRSAPGNRRKSTNPRAGFRWNQAQEGPVRPSK